ncbi:hypothetical protein [Nocardia africana]
MQAAFLLSVPTYAKDEDSWQLDEIPMPATSSTFHVAGSGSMEVRKALKLWDASSARGTSRAVFSAFCGALAGGRDPLSGGGPQLVGIRRIGPAQTFGVVHERRRYVAGRSVGHSGMTDTQNVPLFNELFGITDSKTKRRRVGSKAHTPR